MVDIPLGTGISMDYQPGDLFNMAKSTKSKGKVEKVMKEFKKGSLHSGSKKGPKVTSKKQAVAIAISEAKKGKK